MFGRLALSLAALGVLGGCTVGAIDAPTIPATTPGSELGATTEGTNDGGGHAPSSADPGAAKTPPSSSDAGTAAPSADAGAPPPPPPSSDAGSAGGEASVGADAVPVSDPSATIIKHDVTFYGWADNTPPSDAISNSVLHPLAGGVGTYADPVTFATAPGEWAPGTILYVPFLQKYVIMEDSCVACAKDWKAGIRHIDIWMKSDASNASSLLKCEDAFTRNGADVETNPPPDRLVDPRPLFDPATATCLK